MNRTKMVLVMGVALAAAGFGKPAKADPAWMDELSKK